MARMVPVSGGTTDPRTTPRICTRSIRLCAKSPSTSSPSSSDVRSRSVCRRQLWTSVAPSNTPRTMLVLPTSIARSINLGELFDQDIPELHQAGRPGPHAVLLLAVMLQRERAALRHAGQLRLRDDLLAVEHDREPRAAHRDLERVPLADVVVGVALRRDAGAHGGGHRAIGPVAVHFARSDRPAPDVDLRLARAS